MRFVAQVLLFLPLLLAYWYVHSALALWVEWLPDLFSDRSLRLTGVLAGAMLCGALSGLVLSAPVFLLYRRHAIWVASALAFGAGAYDALHMRLDGVMQFTKVALVLDVLVFVLALPLSVYALGRLRPNYSLKRTNQSLRD